MALSILAGLGLFIYHVRRNIPVTQFDEKIFTALVSMLSSVIGFYFGSRSAAGAKASETKRPSPAITAINPKEGLRGASALILDLAGTQFQTDALVILEKIGRGLSPRMFMLFRAPRLLAKLTYPSYLRL